ncbi:probable G-protein coupled receptor Mth-like 1 [Contarinia nasturtii]|uniref:probable G-protein coupled receptor Mth-like 1 n=1 Tax=Contarinia nasturtii TaxID=265458 RepID=UPI0012D3FFBC|nr:probable G-protein coupled receptor Mth-like 1 [Contarinia nasturtii]
MKSISCSSLFINALIVFVVLRNSEAVPSKKNGIIVNKCCGPGERLIVENNACIIDDDNKWWPLILMIKQQKYFDPKGVAPKYMKYRQYRPVCKEPEHYVGAGKIVLGSNGSLYISEKNKFFDQNNYCVDSGDSAIVCDHDVRQSTKIRKCCVKNEIYKSHENTCIPSNGFIFDDNTVDVLNSTQNDVLFGFPDCKIGNFFTIAEAFKESSLDRNTNRLVLESKREVDWQDYCLEHVLYNTTDNELQLSVFTCADHLSPQTDIRLILFPIGLLISVVFLLVTLATRYVLPSNHHILHWRCQTFYVTCLLIGDLLLALTQLFGQNANGLTCFSIAVCMHFFFLSAFFWLNTMCINIYICFSRFSANVIERRQEKMRLRIYKMYAFGIPFLISGIAATLGHMRTDSVTEDTHFKPRFCESEYWFAGNLEKFAFFYGPVGVLLFINFVLFASTARQLTCGLWKREEVKSTTERTTLGKICMKLACVMGVTWVFDLISWTHSAWFGGSHYIWIVTDLINTLQGVFIFIVIGCQPQVSNVLKQIWRSKHIQFECRNAEGGQRNSTSSQVASSLGESITNNTLTTSNAKIIAETPF